MTEPLCEDNKFYDHICQVILFALYFNKHIRHTRLKELRNTVDETRKLVLFHFKMEIEEYYKENYLLEELRIMEFHNSYRKITNREDLC